MRYLIKTPRLLHSYYRDAVWVLPNSNNEVYLTFDDGPVSNVTDKALAILAGFNVKATFFCVGGNVTKNPSVYNDLLKAGHSVGNHSYSHLKGWKTINEEYFSDIDKCQVLVNTKLFRPPYGKIKRSQLKEISKTHKVIMWSVLSGDFDPKNSVERICNNVIKNVKAGSIIVMHDNEKSGDKMLAALPVIIQSLLDSGFVFNVIK
ncbi:MAG: peptidoglycan/xylan/chitin deacetylase (PgdA/CDA1 family) [Flavobacteriaceae bacterium]